MPRVYCAAVGHGPAGDGTAAGASRQAASNSAEWAAGRYIDVYANRILIPAEVQMFVRYQQKLSQRVLDVGCGAGRMLAYLLMMGAETHGIDLAPNMVDYCRRTLPDADVRVGDAKALKASVTGQFDVVIAPDNLIDVFDDAERRGVIADVKEILAPDGLFIFSTHDLGWAQTNPGPREWESRSRADSLRKLLEKSPASLIQAVRNRREIAMNRKRLAPLEQRHADHAIINDFPHNYGLLHYYIRRDDQERQLEEIGFELIECLAADGRTVGQGESGNTDSLYYVARPA
jgi:2-polyprenyl-3-methyl-5-hydroxy-6-metoxy-1,4-benzoquinol methylase